MNLIVAAATVLMALYMLLALVYIYVCRQFIKKLKIIRPDMWEEFGRPKSALGYWPGVDGHKMLKLIYSSKEQQKIESADLLNAIRKVRFFGVLGMVVFFTAASLILINGFMIRIQ